MKNRFYWDEDTLNAFRFESNYQSTAELLNDVENFVEQNCHLEDGETEEDLVQDLMKQILQK